MQLSLVVHILLNWMRIHRPSPACPPEPVEPVVPEPEPEPLEPAQTTSRPELKRISHMLTRMCHLEYLQGCIGGIFDRSAARAILLNFRRIGANERILPRVAPQPASDFPRELSEGRPFTAGKLDYVELVQQPPEIQPPAASLLLGRTLALGMQASGPDLLPFPRLAWQEWGARPPGLCLSADLLLPDDGLAWAIRGETQGTGRLPAEHLTRRCCRWVEAQKDQFFLTRREAILLEATRLFPLLGQRGTGRDTVRRMSRSSQKPLKPKQYGPMARILRELAEAGLPLPPPDSWREVLRDPPHFPELLTAERRVEPRPRLEPRQRLAYLLEAVPEELRSYFRRHTGLLATERWEPATAQLRVQAIQELAEARRPADRGHGLLSTCLYQIVPDVEEAALKVLKAWYLRDTEREFQELCRRQPDQMAREVARFWGCPADTLPTLTRLGLLATLVAPAPDPLFRATLEEYLGRLPRYRTGRTWIGRVLADFSNLLSRPQGWACQSCL